MFVRLAREKELCIHTRIVYTGKHLGKGTGIFKITLFGDYGVC